MAVQCGILRPARRGSPELNCFQGAVWQRGALINTATDWLARSSTSIRGGCDVAFGGGGGLIGLPPALSDYTMLNLHDSLCTWSVVGIAGSFGNVTDLMHVKTPPTHFFVNARSQRLHESVRLAH